MSLFQLYSSLASVYLPHLASYLKLLVFSSCSLSYVFFYTASYYVLTFPVSFATAVSLFFFSLLESLSISPLTDTHANTDTLHFVHMHVHCDTNTHIHPCTHPHMAIWYSQPVLKGGFIESTGGTLTCPLFHTTESQN